MTAWTVPEPAAADPGRATGTTEYALLPRCTCGHLPECHLPAAGRFKACSAADPGKCPCKAYNSAEETPPGNEV